MFPNNPVDLHGLAEKYDSMRAGYRRSHDETCSRIDENLEKRIESLRSLQHAGLLITPPGLLLIVFDFLVLESPQLFPLAFVFLLIGAAAVWLPSRGIAFQQHVAARQKQTEHDLLEKMLKGNADLKGKLLHSRGSLRKWFRREWLDYCNGRGGFDVYIGEYLNTLPNDERSLFAQTLGTDFDLYVQFLNERSECNDDGLPIHRYEAWKKRRAVDEAAGRPVTLTMLTEKLREESEERTRKTFKKFKQEDLELAGYLAALTTDRENDAGEAQEEREDAA